MLFNYEEQGFLRLKPVDLKGLIASHSLASRGGKRNRATPMNRINNGSRNEEREWRIPSRVRSSLCDAFLEKAPDWRTRNWRSLIFRGKFATDRYYLLALH